VNKRKIKQTKFLLHYSMISLSLLLRIRP